MTTLYYQTDVRFFKYYRQKFSKNIGVFAQTRASFLKKFDHNIGF
jgi:hypothetical protein